MDTWAPLWSKIVESSLWAEPDHVVKVFLTMLAVKDSDHVVRKNAYQLAHCSRKTELEVLDALKILAEPDTRRAESQPYEGRRIRMVEDGWLILNGEYYRAMVKKEMARQRNARAQRAWRDRQKHKPATDQPLPGEEKYVNNVEKLGQKQADRIFDADQTLE